MKAIFLAAFWLGNLASAQEPVHELQARVLMVNENRVQIDRGKDAGVEPGDQVRLHPLGSAEIIAVIERVEDRSAWLEIRDLPAGLEPGTPCQIMLPPGRLNKQAQQGYVLGDGVPNAAPQWAQQQDGWDPSRPLLADEPLRPRERDSIWTGRIFTSFQVIKESEQLDSTSMYGRSGVDLRGNNPFGLGGRVHFALDLDYRSFASTGQATDSDSAARLERLSYAHGGDRFTPLHWQLGRFLQSEFPEFGVLDGFETSYRLADGDRLGGSFGYIPEPGQDYATGQDLQLAAFYNGVLGEGQSLRWGTGLQKTWHDGQADRDLMILKFVYRPDRNFDLRSSAWLDLYDADDVGKPEGMELTTMTARANWRLESSGFSVGVNQWRFPLLARYQAGSFSNEELLNGETTRFDLRAWHKFNGGKRLTGRLDSWSSQDDNGGGAELRLSMPDWLADRSNTSVAIYSRQGSYSDYNGVRFSQSLDLDSGSWRIGWESAQYQPKDGGDSDLLQHDARISWSHWSRDGWSLSLDGGYRFGDQQSSPSLGFYLQRSF